MNATKAVSQLDALKLRLKNTWNTGDYDAFSRYMEEDAERFYLRLDLPRDISFLDVACGSGQLALIAARHGNRVTGCDIAPRWVEKARARAIAEGLPVTFDEGDAEALPYADGQFDVVASLIGAMFAPRPELVAAELKRVCRPGGMIAMANWTPAGFVGQMFRAIARHIAPSGMPSPVLWGDESTVRARFGDGVSDPVMTRRMYRFEYPFPPPDVVEFFRVNYGPMYSAFSALDAAGQNELRSELVGLWSDYNQSRNGETRVDAEFLEVIAARV
jgi:SAM-dependent methyltransferase